MPNTLTVLQSIEASANGLTLAELLMQNPGIARRTAQRVIHQLLANGDLHAHGQGRARRYNVVAAATKDAPIQTRVPRLANFVPVSADSQDILAYVDQPLQSRQPVGYQRDFLDSYKPNSTCYLPEALRRQLHSIGAMPHAGDLAGTYSPAIWERLLIDLSWASSHLEGNTYSRLDTRELIQNGKVAHGKAATETQMILNHKAAIELLAENAAEAHFNRYLLMNLHSALSENLLPNPSDEGRTRQHAVAIGRSVYRPLSTSQHIDEALDAMLAKANRISDPFEQSLFMMVHLPYLQPFADVNKRTSRLAANLPLFKANLCPLTFLDVPEAVYSRAMLGVYEMARVELLRDLYVWAYERSTQEYRAIRQELAEPDPARLAWRETIRATIHDVVMQPDKNALELIRAAVDSQVPASEQGLVLALIVEELRRLHEGVLARYRLRPSEWLRWQAAHSAQ